MNSTQHIRIAILSSILITGSCNLISMSPTTDESVLSIAQFLKQDTIAQSIHNHAKLEQLIVHGSATQQSLLANDELSVRTYEAASDAQIINQQERKKDWTVIIYLAADNNLRPFLIHNIKKMANVGSNDRMTIFVHLDIVASGKQKVTRRYIVNKNELISVDEEHTNTGYMDSGNPETLISCCKWAIEHCPARHYALIFGGHGSGAIDPGRIVPIGPATLFTFNQNQQKLELDRSIEYLDLISNQNKYHAI